MEESKTPEEIRKEAKRLYDIDYYRRNADWIREKCRAAYYRKLQKKEGYFVKN